MAKSLVDLAQSGASVEVILELMAKQIEKRLYALETGDSATKTEQMLSSVTKALAEMKTNVDVAAPKVTVDAPVVNVSPNITLKRESSKMKLVFERNLAGSIESATIIKE